MSERAEEISPGRAALLGLAALAVGTAIHLRNGQYDGRAVVLVAAALAAAGAAVLARPRTSDHLGEPALAALLTAGVALQLCLLAVHPLGVNLRLGADGTRGFLGMIALAAILLAAIVFRARPLGRWQVPALLVLFLAMGLWLLRRAPPGPDVFLFQRDAIDALLAGKNPYAIRFPNIYEPDTSYYGPGLVKGGVLQFGYPYPPLPLLLALPAQVLADDLRIAHLASMTAAGALIAYTRPGRIAPLAAALLLFSPRVGLLLQMSWTEPFLILLLAATVFTAARAPRLLPLALGLLLASKQYLVFVMPAVLLLERPGPDRLRQAALLLGKAILIAAAVSLPLVAWDLREFVRSAVTLQFHQPFRPDALSFLVLLTRIGGPALPWAPFLLAPLVLALALRASPSTPAGFAAVVGLTYLVFFAWNKQAFCNYYFFAIGALCTAVGACAPEPRVSLRTKDRSGVVSATTKI